MPVVKGFAGQGEDVIPTSGKRRADHSQAIPHHNDNGKLVGFRGTRSCVSLGLRGRKMGAVDARIFALQSIASQLRDAMRGDVILHGRAGYCIRKLSSIKLPFRTTKIDGDS
jgi:hypothetical protein